MSIVVTAKIAQNAVFFSDERFRCEITFEYPLPTVEKFSHDKIQNIASRNGFISHTKSNQEPNSPGKKPSPRQVSNGNPLSAIVENPSIQNSIAGDLGESGMFGFRNLVKRSTLTAFASSTLSLFSLGTGDSQPPLSPIRNTEHTEKNNVDQSTASPFAYIEEETYDDGGLINLKQADGSDSVSVSDYDTSESSPRSSADFYVLGYSDDRSSNSWSGSLTDYKRNSGGSGRSSIGSGRCSSSPTLSQKYETLLWGFAQIVGQFVVDSSLVKSVEFEPLKTKTMYRPASGSGAGGAVGSGTLGIFTPNSIHPSSLQDLQERADSRSIPVFSTPPSILFCDLHLMPGETRTYTYETRLPTDLPPTHRGKAIRFNYNLIIGTHRGGLNQQSHIVQLPFRVFNFVSDDGSRPVYDLMNPVIIYKDEAVIKCKEDSPKRSSIVKKRDNKREEFIDYVMKLAQSSDDVNLDVYNKSDEGGDSDNYVFVEKDVSSLTNTATIVSKSARKVNYDICKNNQRVAQLCLLKTLYRLGDIVMGTLNFNDVIIPSYQVSITLENSELIEPSITNRTQQQISRLTRKIHGEHHEFCLNASRISFSIPIPTNSTPDFATTGVKLQWSLRLEFITGSKNDYPLMPLNADERHHYYQAVEDVNVETFDCSIPIKVYPTSCESARTFPSQHTFRVS
ncbi:Rgp1-domain-containing protein [Gigaspora margarita]|uniref:Rgp1-domain-containing protein n=2 Tax=Gigaspora margarita TaxID=4874 RepID=A0A8H3XF42_GIGMA|nr:Rgp1-domain-containing protein [Gigaspora margarita]